MLLSPTVDGHVVDDAALLVGDGRELHLTDLLVCEVAAHDPLEQFKGLGPFDFDLPHVAHVEQARQRPGISVLLDDARVLDRHGPSAEFGHRRAQGQVTLVQRGLFHGGLLRVCRNGSGRRERRGRDRGGPESGRPPVPAPARRPAGAAWMHRSNVWPVKTRSAAIPAECLLRGRIDRQPGVPADRPRGEDRAGLRNRTLRLHQSPGDFNPDVVTGA